MGDPLDKITNSLTATVVGIIFVCSVLLPIALKQIETLTTTYSEAETYTPLITAVIIMAIVGLLIGIIRFYRSGDR